MTDARGVPISVVVAPANVPDFRIFDETIQSIPVKRPRPTTGHPQGLCLDKGYEYPEIETLADMEKFELHLRRKREEFRKPKRGKARRWVVERAHSWFNRNRAILIRWEKEPENYEAMLHIASAIIAFKASKLN